VPHDINSAPADFNFRDDTERREAEQADFLAGLEADSNIVAGPKTWFQNSSWNMGESRQVLGVYRGMSGGGMDQRLAELKAYREQRGEPADASGTLRMAGGFAAALDFLQCLDPGAESFCFQTYDDDKERRRSRNEHPLDRVFNGSLAEHEGELTRLNGEGAGVSVTINETNGRGRRAYHMVRARAVWQEDDNGFPPDRFPLRPSIVVETSPGHFHRYWLVEGLTNKEHKGVMERMVESFGSDKSAKEFNKAMRLPGFWNRKPEREPFHVRVIEANGARYSRDQILRAFPPPPPPKESPRNLAGRRQETAEETKARAIDALNCISPDCRRDDWLAVGMALKHEFGESGWQLWDHWSSGSKEKYKPNDTRDKWVSFKGGNGKPRTIATLFDIAKQNGYRQHTATAHKPKAAQAKLNGGESLPQEPEQPQAEARSDSNRPVIQISGGSLSDSADEAEAALRAADVEIYRQSGILVRPVRIPLRDSKRNEVQIVAVARVTPAMLRDECCRHIRWEKWDARAKKSYPVDPPRDVLEIILDRRGGPWPTFAGVTSTPFLRADGSIASKPGFDDATGMFLMDPVALPDMPTRPTKADAEKALKLLDELLEDFPFMDPKDDEAEEELAECMPHETQSYSVGLSALLSPLARAAVDFVPAHAVRAYVAGSGKSYLLDLSSAITNGTAMPVLAAGADEEETEKRVSSFIIAGVQLISIDNLNGVLSGDLVNQIVTQATVCPRVLGKSKSPPVTNVFILFVNGNNVKVANDQTRRTLFCVLDRGLDAAEVQSHEFKTNPFAMVLADRGRYIAAALTIMRAHHLADYPGTKGLKPYNGFDDWSRIVRGAIVWLGREDPVKTLAIGRNDDPETEEQRAFIEALFEVANNKITALTIAEMIETDALKETLSAFIDFKGVINARAAAKWFGRFKRRTFGRKHLRSTPAGKGKDKWYVSEKPKPSQTLDDDGCSD
jgi:hypothetical protein